MQGLNQGGSFIGRSKAARDDGIGLSRTTKPAVAWAADTHWRNLIIRPPLQSALLGSAGLSEYLREGTEFEVEL